MCRVLAKEVAPFNIRVLTVPLGTFNTSATGLGYPAVLGKSPLPEEYRGSVTHRMMRLMASGTFQGDGDTDKAMRAVYAAVVGVGIGAGRESERLLPLGRDLAAKIKVVRDSYVHAMEVFGGVCNNVFRRDNSEPMDTCGDK
jgi:NAD(P)-dependent dehydrogenase (short-subunit alcohol dehydrogenase family)